MYWCWLFPAIASVTSVVPFCNIVDVRLNPVNADCAWLLIGPGYT